jgi:hypothetical protein
MLFHCRSLDLETCVGNYPNTNLILENDRRLEEPPYGNFSKCSVVFRPIQLFVSTMIP